MVLSLIPARAHSRHPQPASSHPIHSSHKHTSSGQAVCWHKWEQARGHVYSQCSPSHPSLPTPSPSQLLSQSLIPTVAVLPSIPFQPCTLHQLPSYSISASSLASVSTILHSLFHPSQFLSPWPDPSPCSSSSFSPSPVFLPISFPIPISMFYCRFSPLPHLHLHLPPSPSPGPGLLPFQLPNAVVPTGRGHCPQRPLHESALQGLNPHTPRASAAQNLPWVESPLLAGAERAGPDWAASQVLTPHRPPSLSLWDLGPQHCSSQGSCFINLPVAALATEFSLWGGWQGGFGALLGNHYGNCSLGQSVGRQHRVQQAAWSRKPHAARRLTPA